MKKVTVNPCLKSNGKSFEKKSNGKPLSEFAKIFLSVTNIALTKNIFQASTCVQFEMVKKHDQLI